MVLADTQGGSEAIFLVICLVLCRIRFFALMLGRSFGNDVGLLEIPGFVCVFLQLLKCNTLVFGGLREGRVFCFLLLLPLLFLLLLLLIIIILCPVLLGAPLPDLDVCGV